MHVPIFSEHSNWFELNDSVNLKSEIIRESNAFTIILLRSFKRIVSNFILKIYLDFTRIKKQPSFCKNLELLLRPTKISYFLSKIQAIRKYLNNEFMI